MSHHDPAPPSPSARASAGSADRERTPRQAAPGDDCSSGDTEPTEPNKPVYPSQRFDAVAPAGRGDHDTVSLAPGRRLRERVPSGHQASMARADESITRSLDSLGDRSTHSYGELIYGELIPPYRILEKMGGGGCGTVYAAEHAETGKLVAIKVLHAVLAHDPSQIHRFVREAPTLARLKHPAIVAFHESGFLPDHRPYLVMELVRGRNLAALILERGCFAPADVLEMLEPVCDALTAAHRAGIVHRDIKASNIMLVDRGGKRQIKLFDFGIAKLLSDDGQGNSLQTSMGQAVGTPHSMAPEQILGQPVDERTDVYALGVLIYRLLTGQYPFEIGDSNEVAILHLESPPPRPSQMVPASPELDRVVLRAMEKRPDSRYPTVEAMLVALREALTLPAAALRTARPALAIYVEARVDTEQSLGDATVDDLAAVLDAAVATLSARGLQIPLQTCTAVLGVALLEPHPASALPPDAARLAHGLHQELQRRHGSSPAIHVNICCHLGDALVDATPAATPATIVGGTVLDVGAWAPQSEIAGVCATAAAMSLDRTAAPAYVPLAPP